MSKIKPQQLGILAICLPNLASAYSYNLPGAPARPADKYVCESLRKSYEQVRNDLHEIAQKCIHDASPILLGDKGQIIGNPVKYNYIIETQCQPNSDEASRVNDLGIAAYNKCLDNLRIAREQRENQITQLQYQREQEFQRQQDLQRQQEQARIDNEKKQSSKTIVLGPAPQAPSKVTTVQDRQKIVSATNDAQSLYNETKQLIANQERAAQREQSKLAMMQAGNMALSTLTNSLLNEARTTRNEHIDAAVSLTNERTRALAELVGNARGQNEIITSIQKEGLEELERRHNQTMGEYIHNVREKILDGKPDNSTTANISDYHYRGKPDPALSRWRSEGSNISNPQSADDGRRSSRKTDRILAGGDIEHPPGSCDYFTRSLDSSLHWHEEGTMICKDREMYRCTNTTWVIMGNCSHFSNWKEMTVEKIERIQN